MVNSNGEERTYRPGISDMDEEVAPGVTARQFINMSDEERKKLIAVLNEKDPEGAKEEAEYVERAKALTPAFVELFMKINNNDESETN